MKALANKCQALIVALILSLGSVGNIYAQTDSHTITVGGKGSVSGVPDVAVISLHISYTDSTTRLAKATLDKTMSQILQILKAQKVAEEQIKTTNLSFNTEYDYKNSERIIVGQKASQYLSITLTDIHSNPERLSTTLDKIIFNNHISLEDLSFKISNAQELYKQSRTLAFIKAHSKAQEYALLSGRKLGKVISITEMHSEDVASNQRLAKHQLSTSAMLSEAIVSIPSGEESVNTDISVIFELE